MEKLDARLRLKAVTFSDGESIDTTQLNLIVLVGPNNSGKSECLREIEKLASGGAKTVVLKGADFDKSGDANALKSYFEKRFSSREQNGRIIYSFWGLQMWSQSIQSQWDSELGDLAKLFVSRLSTDERLSNSNPIPTVNFRKNTANHPFHILQYDTDVEGHVSNQFNKAFGSDLIVDRFGGSHVGLLVGSRPVVEDGEDRISASYRDKLDTATRPLEKQGDGMRAFATVVVSILAIDTASIILIDEPEAFLHPPQVKLLGEFLSSSIPEGRQVIVATHSREFLMGAVTQTPEKTRIVRLVRDGDINHPYHLDKELAAEISKDAVMRHSAVLDGVFHERVIVCEADADCMFYSAVLGTIQEPDEKRPDLLFVQSGGKQKMPSLLKSLNGLNVPTDIIVDIDALNNEKYFRSLFEQAGGNWQDIHGDYKQFTDAVISVGGVKYTRDLQKYFIEDIKGEDPDGRINQSHKKNLNSIFSDSSPWGRMKQAGASALPGGQPTQCFEKILTACSALGIWIVRVGELEGFCKTVGNKGQRWAQEVLSSRDLAKDTELEAARKFVKSIWVSRL